ncbi:MAG: DAK2 domain-containing protein, partial [Mycoplasmataceae bacterium]|nr:DAK2 domain-containing protein [Mycoplasmataceae bacterium]
MKKINGNLWRDMLVSGSNLMLNNKARIDALNVFPVPDGDTGSNMGATCEYSTKEIVNIKDGKISEVASKFSRGMLMGARGNSGVILSQIFKGFSVGLEGKKEATTFDIVASFDQAKIYAYKSVMKPVEGTILTVIRMISEDLAKVITPANSVETLFEKAVNFAKKAVEATPDLLPVLKEVGVVDSGGEGLRLILEGMYLALIGKPVEIDPNAPQSVDQPFSSNDDFDHDGEFGYCTEMIVELKNPKLFSKEKFLKGIVKMGDSIGLVHDDDILKVHIHTLKPGHVFNFAQKFGEFIFLKSENMQLQANEKDAKTAETSNKKVKIGVVSVNIGQGIIDTAKELGANFVIAGGQS